ncbi:MAG TPA: radical SAM protein [Candidatus Nanoarchaeia archaeon]|nr:radical SAM protein [Candidatus Nanoarchaeia archaeon]
MKVLFINPPTTTCLEETKTGSQYIEENIGNKFFPLSKIPFEVMYKLNKIENLEKDIILLDYEWYKNPNLSKENLIDLIVNKKPDVILTTIISQASADTIDWITTTIKERLPKSIILLGGQAIGHLQEQIFDFCPNINFALIGNSDIQLPRLIERLSLNKQNFKDIDGLIYKKNNNIIKNNLTYENLITYNEEIYKPYENFLKEMVNTAKIKNVEVLCSEEFSKGCPYQCSFCAAKKKYQEKDISKVISTIRYLCSLGLYKFYIEDLTFGVNSQSRKEILKNLEEIKREYNRFGFRCVTRIDLITKDFVNNLITAGCYEVGIGVECNDGSVIKSMNKNTLVNENINSLGILGKSGISFKLFLIEGYNKSNTLSSKRTFELLNYLEDKKYNYFIQPALNRDIIPSQKRFMEKEKKDILKRGTANQLDFRHDCRKQKWDTDKSIRSMCLLMLAYPSTEIGKNNKDIELQKRVVMDIPFLKEGITIYNLIDFLKDLNYKNEKILKLRIDLVHYIEGVYTKEEIKNILKKIYDNIKEKEVSKEVDFCFNKLEENGLLDSFGNPNLIKFNISKLNKKEDLYSKRNEDMFFFWDGNKQRYIYAPLGKKIIKIKTCFYKNIPQDVFEFLIFLKGFYTLEDISNKFHKLFRDKKGFNTINKSKVTIKKIYEACKNYGLCN